MTMKHINRDIFLDFIGEPQDTLRRTESHRGIYQDYIVFHQGIKVHVIMIDVRFHYKEDESEDRLGALQYQWLNDILEQNKDSNVTFIMSGV